MIILIISTLVSATKGYTQAHRAVAPAMQNGGWGLINKQGEWIVQPKFEQVRDFSEKLEAVFLNGGSGYIDEKGGWVLSSR